MFTLNSVQKQYLRQKHFTFKILLLMIVIKPFINTFHDTKLFAGITLLQIFSSFLFVLLMFGILSGVKTKVRSKIFFIYGLFSALYLVNILRVLISNFDLSSIKLISKISMISLIFYYFKKHINLRLDFILIINAFIKSAIPTIILGIIDFLVIGDYQKNREFVRFDSSYGDIATLGLQLNILCIIMFFNILKEHETSFGRNYTYNLTLFLFSIFSLFKISHGSSFAVFGVVLTLFLIFKLGKNIVKNLVFLSLPIFATFFYVGSWIKSFAVGLFAREFLTVISGENILSKTYLFHGRVGRWVRHLNLFDQEGSFNQFFGGIGTKYPYLMGSGPHNDYLRILFSTGYIGLTLFFIFLFGLFIHSFKSKIEDRYMILCAILLILLYSITLTPTIYIDLCIFLFAVIIYNIKKSSMVKINLYDQR